MIAFPGAEGYGKFSKGGRGGHVLFVTNLNDFGSGSLREACNANIPRTVVFRIGGIIQLDSAITIKNPFITIAGQTAPGDGICLKHSGADNFGNSLIHVSTHDVVIRYLKLRRGPSAEGECCGDCLSMSNFNQPIYNIIIDHLSLSWSTDETISSWYRASDLTVQNCLIAEPLYYSTHQEDTIQGHSKAAFFGDYSTDITFYKNIIAHSADRNPYCLTRNSGFNARFQIINNLIYNWVYFGAKIGGAEGFTTADFIGNHLKAGPDTRTSRYELLFSADADSNTKVFVEDNLGHHRLSSNNPDTEWDIAGISMTTPAPTAYRSLSSFTDETEIPILPILDVYDSLLINAGANRSLNDSGKWIGNRDSVDIRIVNDIISEGPSIGETLNNGKLYYGLIDDPSQVGGWPVYQTATPYPDNDLDGMSDVWESIYGFDSSDANDRNLDPDGDGFTNLEEFLNNTKPIDQNTNLPLTIPNQSVLFPNPTRGIVYLPQDDQWTLYSTLGYALASGRSNSIDLSTYPNGVYYILINERISTVVRID